MLIIMFISYRTITIAIKIAHCESLVLFWKVSNGTERGVKTVLKCSLSEINIQNLKRVGTFIQVINK